MKRAFNEFVIEPIQNLAQAVKEGNNQEIDEILKTLEIMLKTEDRELSKERLLKMIMEKWLDGNDCLLGMVANHLPSPKQSQRLRVDNLYEGPMDDECATAIRNCDPNGPVMMHIYMMIPSKVKGRFIAIGRIFSGTIGNGQKVRIMGPNFRGDKSHDLFIKCIQKIVLMTGSHKKIANVPCGNIVGLIGIDSYLVNTGTISTHDDAWPIKSMKHTHIPVINVDVKPKNAADLPKFIEGLKIIRKIDPHMSYKFEETGQIILAGCGELHVDKRINDLIQYVGVEIIHSDPFVVYKETIQAKSNQVCMARSPNKHNCLYVTAEPFAECLSEPIKNANISPMSEPDQRAKILQEDFNWDQDHTNNIWAFGPGDSFANVIVDATKGAKYMNEIKDSIVSGFQWVTTEGCLSGENMRGVKFNIIDASLHTDAIHRRGGQIIPTIRRAFYAAFLTADPAIQEPIFLVQIQCPAEVVQSVYQCLTARRGIIISEEQDSHAKFILIKAYLPADESFGFEANLKARTSGQAFLIQSLFDHWSTVAGDPTDSSSLSYEIIRGIRARKELPIHIPPLDMYIDKL